MKTKFIDILEIVVFTILILGSIYILLNGNVINSKGTGIIATTMIIWIIIIMCYYITRKRRGRRYERRI